MIGQSFLEEIDCGNFFDNIDDILIDFPSEDIGTEFGNGESNAFPSVWSITQPESLPASESVFSSKSNYSDTSTELYVPFEEIVQQEWLSSFADDSFLNKKEDSSSTNTDSSSTHSQSQFRSSSPVSVLESSSSSSLTTTTSGAATAILGKRGRPRTKRPRPMVQEPKQEQEQELAKETLSNTSAAESRLVIRIPKHLVSEHNKKKKQRVKVSSSSSEIDDNDSPPLEQPIRKCMHCEVTKTPQWRQGPLGPKTLCNACGVRYKSGRLFPEYRPAASPTFMPSVHSNSHKKVVEMRSKNCDSGPIGNTETGRSYLQELIPNENSEVAIDYV